MRFQNFAHVATQRRSTGAYRSMEHNDAQGVRSCKYVNGVAHRRVASTPQGVLTARNDGHAPSLQSGLGISSRRSSSHVALVEPRYDGKPCGPPFGRNMQERALGALPPRCEQSGRLCTDLCGQFLCPARGFRLPASSLDDNTSADLQVATLQQSIAGAVLKAHLYAHDNKKLQRGEGTASVTTMMCRQPEDKLSNRAHRVHGAM